MKIKVLLIPAAVCLALSCSGPKALVKDQSGSVMLVKKLKSSSGVLDFRFSGGTIRCSMKKIASLSVNPSEREIYAGETWIRAEMTLKKDKTAALYKGWIRQLTRIEGVSGAGKAQYDLVNVQNFDFMLGKKKAVKADSSAAKPDTTAKPALQ